MFVFFATATRARVVAAYFGEGFANGFTFHRAVVAEALEVFGCEVFYLNGPGRGVWKAADAFEVFEIGLEEGGEGLACLEGDVELADGFEGVFDVVGFEGVGGLFGPIGEERFGVFF